MDTEFVPDLLEMELNRVDAEMRHVGNLFVAESLAEPRHDLELAFGEEQGTGAGKEAGSAVVEQFPADILGHRRVARQGEVNSRQKT